eukprot:c20322_g1_i3 orf=454-1662(-)
MDSLDQLGVASSSHTYKQLKEKFVSNLLGTSMLEISAVCAIVPAFVALRQWGFLYRHCLKSYDRGKDMAIVNAVNGAPTWRSFLLVLVLDFLFVVVPTLACLTILADWIYVCTTFVLCLMGILFFSARGNSQSMDVSHNRGHLYKADQKMFISSYRFVMMLMTCISILAVDFPVYPRRYAKTETYGTGLMDVGVGSFVVANALVSRQARSLTPLKHGGVVRHASPLLLMGFTRLLLTKGIEYQEHVEEYGVHWNFFFTLAAVALLTSFIQIPCQYCGIFGILVLAVYQVVLLCGLNDYLTSSVRDSSIVSLNKEGIFSLFGYWGLYLVSVQLGHYLFYDSGKYFRRIKDDDSYKDTKAAQKRSAVEIWLLCAFLWVWESCCCQILSQLPKCCWWRKSSTRIF